MLRVVGTPCGLRSVRCQPLRRRLCTTAVAAKQSDPLRILFCGSDDFSCESLKALHREHVDNRGLVERLDVMVRPGKMTARGNKVLREGKACTSRMRTGASIWWNCADLRDSALQRRGSELGIEDS